MADAPVSHSDLSTSVLPALTMHDNKKRPREIKVMKARRQQANHGKIAVTLQQKSPDSSQMSFNIYGDMV